MTTPNPLDQYLFPQKQKNTASALTQGETPNPLDVYLQPAENQWSTPSHETETPPTTSNPLDAFLPQRTSTAQEVSSAFVKEGFSGAKKVIQEKAPEMLGQIGEAGLRRMQDSADFLRKLQDFAEKASNTKIGRTVNTVLDALQVGQYITANLADALTNEEPTTAQEVWKAFTDAVTLRKKGDYIDLLRRWLPGKPDWFYIAAGLALDVVADPTTYLSFGGMTKYGKNIEGLATALSKGDEIAEGSRLAKFLSKYGDEALETAAKYADEGMSLAEQARSGMRALVRFDFAGVDFPLIKGAGFFEAYENFMKKISQSQKVMDAWKLFSNIPGFGEVKEPWLDRRDYLDYIRGKNRISDTEVLTPLEQARRQIIKKYGLSERELNRMLSEAVQRKPSSIPEINELARRISQRNQEIYEAERAVQIPVKMLGGELNYSHRTLNPRVAELIENVYPRDKGGYIGWSTMARPIIERNEQLKNLTEYEINDLFLHTNLLDNVFPGLGQYKKKIEKLGGLFLEDPIISLAMREYSHNRIMATDEFLRYVAEKYGKEWTPETVQTMRPLHEEVLRAAPPPSEEEKLINIAEYGAKVAPVHELYQGILFDPNVASMLSKTFDVIQSPTHTRRAVNYIDKALGLWIKWTLAFPEWLVRNVVGNAWFCYLQDVSPAQLKNSFLQLIGKGGSTVTATGKALRGEDILKMARTWGVTGTDYISSEIPDLIKKYQRKDLGTTKYHEWMFKINQFFDDWAKLAIFNKYVEEGKDFKEASRMVKAVTPSMVEYTPLEQWIKRVAPLSYSWQRRNIPVEIYSLLQTPRKFANMEKVKSAIQKQTGYPEEMNILMPEFGVRGGGFVVRKKIDKDGRIYYNFGITKNWWPAQDLQVLFPGSNFKNWTELGLQSLNPAIRGVLSLLGMNQYGEQIKEGALDSVLGFPVSARVANILKGIRPIDVANRLFFSGDKEREFIKFATGLKTYEFRPTKEAQQIAFTYRSQASEIEESLFQIARRMQVSQAKLEGQRYRSESERKLLEAQIEADKKLAQSKMEELTSIQLALMALAEFYPELAERFAE